MRNRPWFAWTGLQLFVFLGVILLLTVGVRALLSGHGQAATGLGYIINIALWGVAVYVISSWAINRDKRRDPSSESGAGTGHN